MYQVGSKVVHPSYGAGVIDSIEEKSIGDITQTYYIIKTLPNPRAMELMVPVSRADQMGLRQVGDLQEIEEILQACEEPPPEDQMERDFRTRQSQLTELLEPGCFSKTTQVARILYYMNIERPLGMTDRRILNEAQDKMAGELALAADISMTEAMDRVSDALEQMRPNET